MLKGVEVGKPKYKSIEVLHMTRTVFAPVMASLKINEVCYIESTRWAVLLPMTVAGSKHASAQ